MKKAVGTVIYKSSTNQTYNITVTTQKGIKITLLQYNLTQKEKPYCYSCFNDLYKSVLTIAKNNNFYFDTLDLFGEKENGRAWYNIQWIDLDNPCYINRYSYNKKGAKDNE